MIGKIYWSVFPYYDRKAGKNSFKKRPVLIISGPRNNDYTVLPVSSVSIKSNLDLEYDIEIDPSTYPALGLLKTCYVRTHKQTIVHQAALTTMIGDMKTDYEDLYLDIMMTLEKFNKTVLDSSLSN